MAKVKSGCSEHCGLKTKISKQTLIQQTDTQTWKERIKDLHGVQEKQGKHEIATTSPNGRPRQLILIARTCNDEITHAKTSHSSLQGH